MSALEMFFILTVARVWRKRYAEERRHHEWVDLGGES